SFARIAVSSASRERDLDSVAGFQLKLAIERDRLPVVDHSCRARRVPAGTTVDWKSLSATLDARDDRTLDDVIYVFRHRKHDRLAVAADHPPGTRGVDRKTLAF